MKNVEKSDISIVYFVQSQQKKPRNRIFKLSPKIICNNNATIRFTQDTTKIRIPDREREIFEI